MIIAVMYACKPHTHAHLNTHAHIHRGRQSDSAIMVTSEGNSL